MQASHQVIPGFNTSQFLNNRAENDLAAMLDVQRLLKEIDAKPGLSGAGVIYFDGLNVLKVREFQQGCLRDPVNVIIRAAPRNQGSASQPTNPALEQKNGPMYSAALEATSAVIACGAAVLGWMVVVGGGIASVPTVGASTAISVLAASAAAASSLQCFAGVGRTVASLAGRDDYLAWLDSEAWYAKTMTALDLVSLAGAGSAAIASVKTLTALKAAGNRSIPQALKQMPRHERKRLTEILIQRMHPGISNSAVKAYIRAGVYPARYSAAEVSRMLKLQLADAVGATLSFTGSAVAGTIRNPTRVRDLVFGISIPVKTL